jgi:outer membrane receptor protein involved in Fe transport
MKIDQDFSPLSKFATNQKQNQHTLAEEFSFKSNHNGDYQWSVGVYGFYENVNTDVFVEMKKDGITSQFGPLVADTIIYFPIQNKTPGWGTALYHQSTYNNLGVEGLSITAGIRLDYEQRALNYNASGKINFNMPPILLDSTMKGSEAMHFTEILPKAAIEYAFSSTNFVYASVAKGYNPGGYNIQVFSDVLPTAIISQSLAYAEQMPLAVAAQIKGMAASSMSVKEATTYNSEYSWNYEIGFKGDLINNRLSTAIALFYIDMQDMQLTKYVPSGAGRMLSNAGKAVSKGVEIGFTANIAAGLSASLNYGYTHATFKDYTDYKAKDTFDYRGNFLPYAPQHTFSLAASYVRPLPTSWLDRFNIYAQYNGAGKIYWNETNNIYQNFYGLLNLKAGVSKGIITLNLWGRNLLAADYDAFYFNSFSTDFFQKGKPLTFGVELLVSY